MQRNGKNRIARGKLGGAGADHPASDDRREIDAIPILQAVHQLADDAVMGGDGTQAIEGRRVGDGFRRERSRSMIEGKRRTQNFAEGSFYEPYRRPAFRTKCTVSGDSNATMSAGRRVHEIANDCREPCQRRGS